jgi:L-seryl-tRNA(Ser) seleniumtransferase
LRDAIADDGLAPPLPTVLAGAVDALERRRRHGVQRVINATGVVVHTNLGRAPLSEAARAAVGEASGYASVEYDLETGTRGSRTAHVGMLAAELCGAETGTAVNNGAAALLLAVAGLAGGREVIVSRGELVEIGGSFRLPEIIAAGGAKLVEVGTTNRTRLADYRRAIGPDTGMILKVHRSNFRLVGFTEDTELGELVALGAEHELPVVFDAGSGLIDDDASAGIPDEPEVRAAVASGADLVLFSGDKLLGGPQAGLIVGNSDAVERCRTAPLARALRIDKLQIAALEATLLAHLRTTVPLEVPVIGMLHADPEELRRRAAALKAMLTAAVPGVSVEAVALDGVVGGGAAPGISVASHGIRIRGPQATHLASRLREQDPPVIVRVEDDGVLLDVRTIHPTDEELVVGALQRCLQGDSDPGAIPRS